jgi:hypothetical protein
MNIQIRISFLAALIFAWFSNLILVAEAQGTSGIKGTIADEMGQPIAKVRVILLSIDEAHNQTTKTNEKGEYTFLLGAQGGLFQIIVPAHQYYQPQYRENVRQEMGETREENFILKKYFRIMKKPNQAPDHSQDIAGK